jgi:uncharacterized protein (DUF2252 family)
MTEADERDAQPRRPGWAPLPSREMHASAGRSTRSIVPRDALAGLTTTGRDPLGILARQNADRLQELLPIRTERMAQSPFAFYRGTAAIMAADLSQDPHTGILVGSCGDAHVANFGFYAGPQRTLVFDLNDFDEAAWAPWEWDLKRLVTSIVIAGRAAGHADGLIRDAATSAVRTYADALRAGSRRSPLQRYFEHLSPDAGESQLDDESRAVLAAARRDAEKRTVERAARKLTERTDDGQLRFIERPPTMTHVEPQLEDQVHELIGAYLRTVSVDIWMLLQQYGVSDIARRVVGVGSVGTRCHLTAFDDGEGNALLLQSKQATQSVLAEYGGIHQPTAVTRYVEAHGEGARVVALQRILQAVSDPFLGHFRYNGERDYYVRQFHDMKGGIDMETLEAAPFRRYADACATVLARAHGQSPNAPVVAGYVGGGKAVAEAIVTWSYAYAELSLADYRAFVAAA